jgi:hypothetical protein
MQRERDTESDAKIKRHRERCKEKEILREMQRKGGTERDAKRKRYRERCKEKEN